GPEQELRPELGEAAPGGPGARAGLEVDGQRRRPAELVLPRGEQRVAALAGVDVEPELGARLRPRRRPARDGRQILLRETREHRAGDAYARRCVLEPRRGVDQPAGI